MAGRKPFGTKALTPAERQQKRRELRAVLVQSIRQSVQDARAAIDARDLATVLEQLAQIDSDLDLL